MRSLWKSAGLAGLLAAAAFGQSQTETPSAGAPAAQRRAARGEPGPARPAAIFERLGKQLDLDEEQRGQYDKIVAEYREKVAVQRQGQAEAAELVRKMREARQAGDQAQVQQIREQMRDRRGAAGGEVMQRFFDDVEKILRDDQKEKLGDLRERIGSGGPRGERGPRPFLSPDRQIAQLRDRLELSDEQKPKFDSLASNLTKKLSPDGKPTMGELMQQLREAYASGDEPEQARLRKAVGEQRTVVEQALAEFAAQIEPTLTEDQKATFADFRTQAARGAGPRAGADGVGLRGDPRMLLRAVKRLELSQEQKDQIRVIESDLGRQLKSSGREDMAGVRADLEKQLRSILTADQHKQLDEILARQKQNAGRARRAAAPPAPSEKHADVSP